MVFTPQPMSKQHKLPWSDPTLMRTAKQLYDVYCAHHQFDRIEPTGIAIHRHNYHCKLLFSDPPVLLPQEYFIPIEEVQ
jgi:hypothetical protein